MIVHLRDLGVLKHADVQLGRLTIVCGGNNTGKTYATYALYSFLDYWRDAYAVPIPSVLVDELYTRGTVSLLLDDYLVRSQEYVDEACEAYQRRLATVFAAPKERFRAARFRIELEPGEVRPKPTYERRMKSANSELFVLSKAAGAASLVVTLLVERDQVLLPREVVARIMGMALRDVLFGSLFPRPFISCAERTGIATFRKELNFARNRAMEELARADKDVDVFELLTKVYDDYAYPVKSGVDFARQLESFRKDTSFIAEEHAEVLEAFGDIIGGELLVTDTDELNFVPRGTKLRLTMDESSSAVRSCLALGFYLRHVAQPGDLLMVDEPELSLHPANQRRVARLLARIVNLGVSVFLTTHSDYLIRELNTLILLRGDRPHLKRIAEAERYGPAELLDPADVRVYIAGRATVRQDGKQRASSCQTLTPAEVSPDRGIAAPSFDQTIDDLNRIQDEIIWGAD